MACRTFTRRFNSTIRNGRTLGFVGLILFTMLCMSTLVTPFLHHLDLLRVCKKWIAVDQELAKSGPDNPAQADCACNTDTNADPPLKSPDSVPVNPANPVNPVNPVPAAPVVQQLVIASTTTTAKPLPPYETITCNHCFVRNYTMTIRPKPPCHGIQKRNSIFAAVLSKPDQSGTRDIIRQSSWLVHAKNNTAQKLRYVFLVGQPLTVKEQKNLEREAKIYGDIAQQNFADTYVNLTLKTLFGLEYGIKYCKDAAFIMKIDTDVFINFPKLQRVIETKGSTTEVMGNCRKDLVVLRQTDNIKEKKWVMTYDEYKQEVYPPYCEGPRYIIPMQVAKALVNVSPNVPFFRMEDTYIAMCLAVTPYRVKNIPDFDKQIHGVFKLQFNCTELANTTTSHSVNKNAMFKIFQQCHLNGGIHSLR